MKYSIEFKLECVKKYKKGIEIKKPDFANTSQKNFLNQVYFWEKIYDKLRVESLKKKPRNKKWTIDQRLNIVKRFLAGEIMIKISLENNHNPSLISFWAKKYLESGTSGLELNKGRPIMKSKIIIIIIINLQKYQTIPIVKINQILHYLYMKNLNFLEKKINF